MSDKDRSESAEQVIRGILQYLVEHPEAKDTCEGILKWWRPKVISEWGKDDVQKALDFLTSKGWLTERKTTRLKKIYGVNKDQLKEIKDFLNHF